METISTLIQMTPIAPFKQNPMHIINSKPNNRSRKSELFDELIEIARSPTEDKKSKVEWENFEKKLNEYFDDQHPYSCGSSAHKRRRKFFQQPDTNLFYPIHHAVLNNNLFILKKLVDDYGCDINIRTLDYDTVLMLAARAESIWKSEAEGKQPKMIEYLLEKISTGNAKAINKTDDEYRTALHHAILHRRFDYMKWLIKHGADINVKTLLKATALHFACFSAKNDGECLRMLKILYKKPEDSTNELVRQKDSELARQKDSDNLTAICIAARRSFEQSVGYLLDSYQCSQLDNCCDIELEYGVRSNNENILDKIYLKHKNCCSQRKNTYKYLLHLAAKFNNNRKVLIGADDSKINDEFDKVSHKISTKYCKDAWDYISAEGYTPVHIGAHYGNNAFIQYVIKTVKNWEGYVCQPTQNSRKMNVLHICVEQSGPAPSPSENVNNWIKYDCHPMHSSRKMNVLHICVEQSGLASSPSENENEKEKSTNSKYLEICHTILSLDSEYVKKLLQAVDNDKNTPLHLAARMKNEDIFKRLLECGGNLNCSNLKDEKEDYIYGVTVPRNWLEQTPLFECAKYNRTSFMEKLLLPREANSSKWKQILDQLKDENQNTCLHIACTNGNMDTVKYLITEHQMSVNVYGSNRQTPLYGACEGGFLNVVQYLLDYTDADPTIRTAKGYNCLDIAIARHHPEIVKRLLKYQEWRTLMESVQYEGSDVPITPMRRLIISMPDIAYELIDKHFTTVIGDVDQPKHLIKYDYTFIDDHYNICDWQSGDYNDKSESRLSKWFTHILSKLNLPGRRYPYTPVTYKLLRNHPLLLMSQCNQEKLICHQLCLTLLGAKFHRFTTWVLLLFFLSYIMFMTLYTVVVLQAIHPQYYYNLYNSFENTSNQSINWDYGFNSDLCRQVGIYLIQSGNTQARKTTTQKRYIQTLYVLLTIFLIKNALLILASFPRFIRKTAYYIEGLALILVYLYIRDDSSWQTLLSFRCPIQWELYETVFGTPFEAIFRTALSLFDLGYENRLYTPPTNVMYYPVIYFVFILTEIILTILITNMLIGLAVGEIPTLKTQATLQRNKMLYELFFDYEIFHLQLKKIPLLFLYLLQCRACRRRPDSGIQSHRTKPSPWLCEVHVTDEIDDDQSPNAKCFVTKYFKKLQNFIKEDDIQSLIVTERKYKKYHRDTDKKKGQKDGTDDDT
ncbi:unnamed protein product [Adineta steineri]|uniref:Uncharacterized protein n=1 Tax=Adineta steineri TaxID=433720 RepID=A0A818UPV3_9BILA|nr:unnamed protein product [Adineta steineri]